MAQSMQFCLDRAEEAAKEALGATLDNVRDRALRSEAAWRSMFLRLHTIETNRDRRRGEGELGEGELVEGGVQDQAEPEFAGTLEDVAWT